MGAPPPVDNQNLVEKYGKYSHDELYRWLKAGDSEQVDDLLAEWKKIVRGAHDLHTNLRTELATLGAQWSSAAGDEFQRRMALVSQFAEDLSTDIGTFQTTMADLSADLREAQKQNENPDRTDDNDSTMGGAVAGAVVAGPVGGLIGGVMGHNRDKHQREQARNRMVALVAGLAGEYQTGAHQWSAPDWDHDMPGDDTHDSNPDVRSATSTGTSGVPATDPAANRRDRHGTFDVRRPDGPHAGDGNRGGTNGDGGARPDVLGSTALAGAGAGPTGAGVPGDADGSALASAPQGAGGVGAGVGRFGPAADGTSSVSGRGAPGRRGGGEDEPAEYSTWLTEDEQVWGGDEEAASGVLGGRPRASDDDA